MMSATSQSSILQRSFSVLSVILLSCLRLSSMPLLILNLFKRSYWLIFFSIGLLHFILISAKWFRKIMGDLIKILGGSVVPIWYFPKQLAGIVLALPFWLLFQFPQSVLIGKLSMQEIRTNLLLLYVWVIVFALAAVILWRISVRFITIQGG